MEDETLTSRIRAAYEGTAVPTIASPRLGAGARHSRSPRAVALFGAVAILALALFVWLRMPTDQPALGWQPIPRPPDASIVAQADRSCGVGATTDKSDSGQPISAGLPLAIVDARGRAAVAFFTDGNRFAVCEFSWADDGTPLVATAGLGGQMTPAGSLDVITSRSDNAGRYRVLLGHAPPGTVAVIIELANGPITTASLANGYYLAWWTSFEQVIRVTANDTAGAPIGTFVPQE
jgi:hypothetical protein